MSKGRTQPGASRLRDVIGVLNEQGCVVLPGEWDAEYVLEEINKRLRTTLRKGKLIEHSSFGAEGIVGAKVRAIVVRRLDPTERTRE